MIPLVAAARLLWRSPTLDVASMTAPQDRRTASCGWEHIAHASSVPTFEQAASDETSIATTATPSTAAQPRDSRCRWQTRHSQRHGGRLNDGDRSLTERTWRTCVVANGIGSLRSNGVVFVVRRCASAPCSPMRSHWSLSTGSVETVMHQARSTCAVRMLPRRSGAAIVCIARHGMWYAHPARREPRRPVGHRCRDHPRWLEGFAYRQLRLAHRGCYPGHEGPRQPRPSPCSHCARHVAVVDLSAMLTEFVFARDASLCAPHAIWVPTIQRCAAPGSKLYAQRWFPRTALRLLLGVVASRWIGIRYVRGSVLEALLLPRLVPYLLLHPGGVGAAPMHCLQTKIPRSLLAPMVAQGGLPSEEVGTVRDAVGPLFVRLGQQGERRQRQSIGAHTRRCPTHRTRVNTPSLNVRGLEHSRGNCRCGRAQQATDDPMPTAHDRSMRFDILGWPRRAAPKDTHAPNGR